MTIADEENEVQENVVSSLNQNSKFWLVFSLERLYMLRGISAGEYDKENQLLFQPRAPLLQSKPPPIF